MQTRECQTCWRQRPEDEFALEDGAQYVPICRPCREKLWDDPDDVGELRDADVLAKAELRAKRLAAIEAARRL